MSSCQRTGTHFIPQVQTDCLSAAIKQLDETPDAVLEHDKKQSKPAEEEEHETNAKHHKKPNPARAVHHEKHSLRAKHGKTHAVC